MRVIGIDIGGTKITAGIINRDGEIIQKLEARTPVESGGAGVLSQVKSLIIQLQKNNPNNQAIGIGSAGRIDKSKGIVRYATDNLPGWMGTPLKKMIEEAFLLPVYVDNDVNTAALGEGWLGAGRGKKHYLLMTIGTGVGGALVHDGKVVDGPLGGAGEIGHMILYPGGAPCNCGQNGCLEQYVSGTALNRFAQVIDKNWDSHEMMTQVAQGNKQAMARINQYVDDLAISLVSLFNVYDPELMIIGGGVVASRHLWWDKLETSIVARTEHKINIVPAVLDNQAGMIGAARYALDEMIANR